MFQNCNVFPVYLKKEFLQSALYMLRRKKINIIRKILKFSKLSSKYSCRLKALLKTLTTEQLNVLMKCLQSKGGIESDCILCGSELSRQGHLPSSSPEQTEIKLLLAQAFRFPELTEEAFLKSLVCCSRRYCKPGDEQCINPYHTSLVVDTRGVLLLSSNLQLFVSSLSLLVLVIQWVKKVGLRYRQGFRDWASQVQLTWVRC